MRSYNSIRSTRFLLYLIVCIISGCAEKVKTHAFVRESPLVFDQALYITPTRYIAPTKIDSSKNIVIPKFKNKPILKDNPLFEPHLIHELVHTTKLEQPTLPHKTVWDRLFSLYSLPKIENERIEQEIQRYLQNPEFFSHIQKRAEPYLYFILDEIEAKNIPGELALLPIVESSFKPAAISRSKALGLWQFMPATGRLFGLKQNWWYDGRKDVYKSTKAATTYLKQLNNVFDDDWLLAMAAYNAGKGNIRKAIQKNNNKSLATDYWSLPLPRETMKYVPKLLAIAKILANAEKHNISLQHIPNKPYFTVVNFDSQLDLIIAAEMAETPLADFFILNPAFKKGSTDPDGPYHLLIQTEKAEVFKHKLAQTLKKDRLKWKRHKIKNGENLGLIANKYFTSVNALRQSNKLANSKIKAGQFLLIPTSYEKQNRKIHTVKRGDTFWEIARQYSVKSKDIAKWNNISLTKALQPGQKLIIGEG